MGAKDKPIHELDNLVFAQIASQIAAGSNWPGLSAAEIQQKIGGTAGPERLIDALLCVGPYGDGFGWWPDGLCSPR